MYYEYLRITLFVDKGSWYMPRCIWNRGLRCPLSPTCLRSHKIPRSYLIFSVMPHKETTAAGSQLISQFYCGDQDGRYCVIKTAFPVAQHPALSTFRLTVNVTSVIRIVISLTHIRVHVRRPSYAK